MATEKSNRYSGGGKPSKPLWKKWWFWAIVAVVLISGTNTISNNSTHEEEPQKQVAEESTEKQTVEETQKQTEPVSTAEESAMEEEKHIYDTAIIKPVMNGSRTEEIGEYSIIEMDSSLLTDESLADWYFNYVLNNDFNWCMILYTDKNNEGVYSIEGLVEKDVVFDKDEFGDYSLGDSSHATILAPTDEGTLKEIK